MNFPQAPPIPEFIGPPIMSKMQGPVPFLPKDTERFTPSHVKFIYIQKILHVTLSCTVLPQDLIP